MTKAQPNAIVACSVAREAISALVDGEELPVPESVAKTHLSQCKPCSEFQARVVSLTRELSVRVVPPDGDCTSVLTSFGLSRETLSERGAPEPSRALRLRSSFVRATQWTAGVAPLVVAVPALALGVFAHTHIAPTHQLAPCMMSLARHWR